MSLQKYTKEWLEQLCAESRSYAEVLRKAGRAQAGGSQRTLKEKIKEWNIDISHFSGQRWRKTIMFQEKYLPENLFRKDGTNASNQTIRRYLLEYHLLDYVCEGCGCNGTWQGEPITLQLHHKDGNRRNNELSNLSFLCPNCHAITDNFGGKKNKGQKREK